MGSITKRKTDGKFLAQVLIHGERKSKVFARQSDAKQWIFKEEINKVNVNTLSSEGLKNIEGLIEAFIEDTGQDRHSIARLRADAKLPIFQIGIRNITTETINKWIQGTLNGEYNGRKVKPSSVERRLHTLSAFFTWAEKKRFILKNPTKGHEKIEKVPHRERTATSEEIQALMEACKYEDGSAPKNQMQLTFLAFVFSCNTGMRAGEILQIERSWREGNLIHIPKEATKTNASRTVMMNEKAEKILAIVESLGFSPNIWGIKSGNRDQLWRRLRDKAGLRPVVDSKGNVIKEGLNFHDGRATFCTWAASPGKDGAPRLDVMSLARQTGHKDLKMLMRYYRPDMNDLVKRLND